MVTENNLGRMEIEAEIGALADLDLPVLRGRWQQLFGNPAPKSLRKALLVKACAYQIQVGAFGGLSAPTKKLLRQVAEAARQGVDQMAPPRIKPGTLLMRSWQGQTHAVTALAEGFEWDGRRFGSLSAVAKAITGTNWNGLSFFGLKRVPITNKNGAGPRRKRHD